LSSSGASLVAREIAVPKPGRGEVLIRVAAAVINPSDLHLISRPQAARLTLGIPGLEGSGTVVAAGPGLFPRLLVGRRVAFASANGGAWAEYAVTAAMRSIPLRKTVSLEQGASLMVNPLTALGLVDIAVRGKHRAVVSNAAAGALGRMVFRQAEACGITVINLVRRPEHVSLLHSLGAAHVLDVSDPQTHATLRELTHRLRATLAFDAVGGPLAQVLFDAMPTGSTIVVYGALSEQPCTYDARSIATSDKRIRGFYLGTRAAQRSLFATVRDVIRVQRLVGGVLQTAVHRRFTLAEAQDAVEYYASAMTAGKVLLVADDGEGRP
jgi:NADPH:quinone reductase-like Zn-dependent oxidoreductase